MNRRILCVLLLLSMALGLFGCHGKQEKNMVVIPEVFDTSRNFEVTFWAKNDTNLTQVAIYKKAIADFEKLYPNITVNMRLYTDYGRIYNDVITNIATDTTPNVCITYPDHIATYLTGSNAVVPLDAFLDDPRYGLGGSELLFDSPMKSEIIPKFLEEGVIDGSHYAIPFMRSTEVCYVNKTYVEKLGFTLPAELTWDFIWQVSEAAAKKGPDGNYLLNDQPVMIPFIYKSTDNMMIQQLRQLGAGYSTEAGEIEIFNDTTRKLLYTVAEHAASGAFSTFKISSYPANFLNAGQCVFAIDSTAGATWMGAHAPLSDISPDKFIEFETEVLPIPQFEPQHPKMISQGPSICVFNKDDPQQVLASWLFAQFLLTNDVQISYSKTEGYLPVTSKAQGDARYQDYLSRAGEDNEEYYDVKLKASKLLMDNTENTFVTPVFNGSASLRNAAGQMIENVTKAARRDQTVDAPYLEELFSEVTSLYRLDQLGNDTPDKKNLGPLPPESAALLSTLAVVWVFVLLYLGKNAINNRKHNKNTENH